MFFRKKYRKNCEKTRKNAVFFFIYTNKNGIINYENKWAK